VSNSILPKLKLKKNQMKTRKLIYPVLILGLALFIANSCKKDDGSNSSETVTDVDGNVYHTVTVKSQTWMLENLKTTRLNDSTAIPNVTDNSAWIGLTAKAYCWYNNDVANKAAYGALYNWYAVNNSKLCPKGWHVPSDAEWITLISNLGGDSTLVGGYLKEAGTTHWITPNTGADNSSGFTALPGGSRYTNAAFYYNGKYGWYWSSTAKTTTDAWHIYVNYNSSSIVRKTGSMKDGFSVRCIKGSPPQ
jgi:uncharacterized protein (TIGR02145 family)